MKKFIATSIIIMLTMISFAQERIANMYLEYDATVNEIKKTGKFYGFKGESVFYFEKGNALGIKERVEHENGIKKMTVLMSSAEKIHGKVETNLKKKQIISSERIFKQRKYSAFIVEEELRFIKWKLIPEKRKIGNFTCLKAEGTFKGRFYTVWYTPEVVSILGPWKFHGLPGVVVEVYDKDLFIHLMLTKIQIKQQQLHYKALDKEKAIKCVDFFKLKNEQSLEIKKHIQSKLPRGASFQIKKTNNNWLEKTCR